MVWVMSPKQPWWSIWISTAAGFRPSRVVEYSCYSQIFLQFRFIELMQTHCFKRWILCEDMHPKFACPAQISAGCFALSLRCSTYLKMHHEATHTLQWFQIQLLPDFALSSNPVARFGPVSVHARWSNKTLPKIIWNWGIYIILFPIFPWNPKLYWNFKRRDIRAFICKG